MTPSQILLQNQDANVDNLIKLTRVTMERVNMNRRNNFGIPTNVNWERVFRNYSETKKNSPGEEDITDSQGKTFDIDLFFNDLKWHNSTRAQKTKLHYDNGEQSAKVNYQVFVNSPLSGKIIGVIDSRP